MRHLVLHPITKQHVAQYVAHPSHAILLIGTQGAGKTAIARGMIAEILGIDESTLSQQPYILTLQPDNDTIPIDAIRKLQRFLQLKTTGRSAFRRGVIVEHAEKLTIEAQNAFLKLLEEPPADTVIILTASNHRALLPTIISRTQTLSCITPEGEALASYFMRKGKDPKAIQQAFFLSGGLPGLMAALLDNDQDHPLMQGVTTAKQILQLPTFERLLIVERLSKKKEEAFYVVEALLRIAHAGLEQAATNNGAAKLKQWHHILKQSMLAHEALSRNANLKLTLNNLMLQIKH